MSDLLKHIYCLPLTPHRLGPYKLAYVLNKCLDRFEHPGENVQRSPNPTFGLEVNLTQSKSSQFGSPSALSPPAASPAFSPPAPEMPPLMNQPYWHATDKPQAATPPWPDSQDPSTPTATTPVPSERALPVRPKLTIPSQEHSVSSNILITDDNAINRRVSLLMRC